MHKMAERKESIKLLRLPKSEAIDMACAICSDDNLALLAQVPDDTVLTINLLEGVPGYLFGPMCRMPVMCLALSCCRMLTA